ncbi:hypothetical protein MPNT_50100 [Candidatus Methylacidithermus pantelleriae]|uniref:Uncharacterized protein n=1 Tax=Candidatus Methylacidithermus pantelleriae TaxID=2744239 RepID=A0A8J2BVL6_9BACT|nr:hypothetical protein MPNT_50100 [Candidatus Methylacidithermus pantelleriae]
MTDFLEVFLGQNLRGKNEPSQREARNPLHHTVPARMTGKAGVKKKQGVFFLRRSPKAHP